MTVSAANEINQWVSFDLSVAIEEAEGVVPHFSFRQGKPMGGLHCQR